MKILITSIIALASSQLVDRFNEGGTLFMSLILICLLTSLVFLIMGFLNLKKDVSKSKKMIALASDASILGLVIGLLGSIIGMIEIFDYIDYKGEVSSAGLLAGGLKVTLLTTVFGAITFILPRIGIILLKALQKT